ncbi:MAG: glycosyltransferase family 1 protein, partial [Alphaproteobacteria bacterium]|nr:glycosyltransferase family 1 protein [Alphaproteobacteria bacterium]
MEPRVLCFYLGSREHYRPVMFSTNEVFVSPDGAESADHRGIRALRPPASHYDVAEILARLPAEQHPELTVVKVDASLRNVPRGLGRLPGRKVLVLGDTHHLSAPIRRLLDYAAAEPFDLILSDHDRHHLHFFRKAGFPRVAWIPCLTWRPFWREPAGRPDIGVAFVGQTGPGHPWRGRVLDAVRDAGLPLRSGRLTQEEAANVYARARVSLNCSLNGDLNLRVFEVLAAGGLLLGDRLRPESGLARIFEEGRHFVAWSDQGELIEKARHYLDHPDENRAIREAGRRRIEALFHPERQRWRLFDLLFEDREDPLLSLDDEPRCGVALPVAAAAWERARLYEWLQDLHRPAARLRLFGEGGDLAEDGRDLPRLSVHPLAELAAYAGETGVEHLLVLRDDAGLDAALAEFRGRHVVIE